jgi:hypothetical protein
MSSLEYKVRGEFVPIGQGSLHLLEVVCDEQQKPFWKARCMQTGSVLRVALDGVVQQATASNLDIGGIDRVNQQHRSGCRKFVIFVLFSALLAASTFVFRDQLQPYWERALAHISKDFTGALERLLP